MPVAVVIDVPVSPSSVVTEVCDVFSLGSDWEFVEPQSFSFCKKRSFVWAENQGENELRRVASKSASEYQKKDAADATSKFAFVDG